AATLTGFVALARHPSLEVRKGAIELLARRPEPEAQRALVSALDDSDPEVCKTALSSLTAGHRSDGKAEAPETLDAIIALLEASRSWSIRSHAAKALGRIPGGDRGARINESLKKAALE